jgi:Spirocyclase AveC-like
MFAEVWTIVGWITAGPYEITQYRRGHTLDWWAARAFEGLAIVLSVVVLARVVKACRRERRVLTFDVMFLICAATQTWADFADHFFAPFFAASSNWVNVDNMCGHIPFVVNPDCGRAPDPILFLWLLETFVVLGAAMAIGRLVRSVRTRWPGLSTAQLVGIVVACGCVCALFEPLAMISLHLWSYPGFRWSITINGGRYAPFPELLGLGLYFGLICAMHVFRDDQGRRFMQRGLDHHAPRTRTVISMMAMYTCFQLIMWGFGNAPLWPQSLDQQRWDNLPAYINNGLCNQPSVGRTRYGPCPGSAGFRMPIAGSLPGSSP